MNPEQKDRLGELAERERELEALASVVEGCLASKGGAAVIEGPAGIGKTSLVDRARLLAAERGIRVVSARGAELERSFPYGVVRQFFESFLFTVDAAQRPRWLRSTAELAKRMFGEHAGAGAEPADEFALLHSLYWMCVSIADETPLLMTLDDAQWADAPSLRFVEFSCRRLEQLPFAFVIATRAPDEGSPPSLIALSAERSAQQLRPAPLSLATVQRLISVGVDEQADTSFAQACLELTGGNPFLLGELAREVREESLPTTAAAADRVRALGPRGIARVVLLRLGRLPEGARRLAAALSVAADGLRLVDIGELAGLDEQATLAAAAGLEAAKIAELRDGPGFIHPVLRTAVYEDLPLLERSAMHLAAARLKAERRRPPAEIAGHLLHVEPGENGWVAGVLRESARQAMSAGDFADAERLLTRAMLEHEPELEHGELLAELGSAQARAGKAEGTARLRDALGAAPTPERAGEIAIELATVLKFSGAAEEAADVLLDALPPLEDRKSPLVRRIYAELLGTRFISPLTDERIRLKLASLPLPSGPPSDLLDSFLLAAAAFDSVAALRPAGEAIELGRRALSGGLVSPDPVLGGQVLVVVSVALIWAEDLAFVFDRYTEALAEAERIRSPIAVGNSATMRAMCGYRAGRLLEAESDAATVLELAPQVEGLRTLLAPAVAYAVLSGIERGTDLDGLRTLAFDPTLDLGASLLPYTQLSWARGELCVLLEDWERALVHFHDCDRAYPGFGGGNPGMVPWREGAAIAHARMGELELAHALTEEAVRLATRFGAPRALGVALRAEALVSNGEVRMEGLARAASVLKDACAPLELARTQVDLGAALRAAGRRGDAQQILERARDLALQLGATRVGQRATGELEAAGVKPRREPVSGLAALTPSERRVAEFAAQGKTNREIAQVLFVTEKTIETHLGHVYDKLGVRSRRKLPEALRVRASA